MSNLPEIGPGAIAAAGGIVLGAGANAGKIAVIVRRRYGMESALPKGKLTEGEEPAAAALREVREETGYAARIKEYAGTTSYLVKGAPKVVFYFLMEAEGGGDPGPVDVDEVAHVKWMHPGAAVGSLTHREDRELVSARCSVWEGAACDAGAEGDDAGAAQRVRCA
jgi:8-oxo-dGTP diphosphatase